MTHHQPQPATFRAMWPVINNHRSYLSLIKEANEDLPNLLAQTHVRPTGPGRFTLARSIDTPGSGRITEWVLIYEAPATPRKTTRPHRNTTPKEHAA